MHTPLKKINIVFLAFIVLLIVLLAAMALHKKTTGRYALLSFDVEPVDGQENITELVGLLQAEKINATFFVTGEYAEQFPRAVLLMSIKNEVGCHGYSHKSFTSMNHDEKTEEIMKCKTIVENITGKKIEGFRAPYNRIDRDTMKILEEYGFTYDATIINGLGIFYPSVKELNMGEIPVSSMLGIPLEDVIWTYYLHMPGAFFYILQNKKSDIVSYLFHPHHIMQNPEQLKDIISHLKSQNITFISHQQLTRT